MTCVHSAFWDNHLVQSQVPKSHSIEHCVEHVMRVLITGSRGLIGGALVSAVKARGDEVVRLVRPTKPQAGRSLLRQFRLRREFAERELARTSGSTASRPEQSVVWDPFSQYVEREGLEGIDAVVHLAGENIAARRWSLAQKARIRDSRVDGTRLICETLAALTARPQLLISMSGISYYGDRGQDIVDESSTQGHGFLAQVCQDWESATEPARRAGIRVVNLRCGVVLSREGGALAQMLFPFRLGLGGVIGSGKQYWSWIAIEDVVRSVLHLFDHVDVEGPVNCTAPEPVTNSEFTAALGRVLHRPAVLPVPAPLARLALGEMAQELLLASTRAVPKKLLDSGYESSFPRIEPALSRLLRR